MAGGYRTVASLAALDPEWQVIGDPATTITDIQYDSRLAGDGCLFVALRGGYVDGHDFVADAVRRGASAALVERPLDLPLPQLIVPDTRRDLATIAASFFDWPSRKLDVVGITGTDGKTTTSYILDHLLRANHRVTGMIGTVSVRIGDTVDEHETRQTTPESVEIQRYLRRMIDAGVKTAILEATSHGLDLHRLDETRFVAGAVTNITQEHLEHHKTIEAYWRAKARLFERVASVGGLAVVNLDDAGARSVLPYCVGCSRIVTYSLSDPSADLFCAITESGLAGSRGTVIWGGTTYPFVVPLAGGFNVSNALAALGLAIGSGVAMTEALAALATQPPVPGRMTSIDAGQPFGVVVDYAHTPESMTKVLELLRLLSGGGRLISVFGSAGERDEVKRPIQGRVAVTTGDIAVITNEDPRFEDAESILRAIAGGAIEAGATEGTDLFCIVERRDAIRTAFALAQPGDTVLLAGKGHEQSIIWNGEKLPWDDASVARDVLAEMGWS